MVADPKMLSFLSFNKFDFLYSIICSLWFVTDHLVLKEFETPCTIWKAKEKYQNYETSAEHFEDEDSRLK